MPIQTPRHTRGWTRHLEGWQPALLSVVIAASVAVLVVPRDVEPRDVPPPDVNPKALAELRRLDEALAARAESEVLDADIRALGSAIRAFGRADAAGDEEGIWDGRRKIADALGPAFGVGQEFVLVLRAYQLRRFLMEVRHWEVTGEVSEELLSLGGGFVAMLKRNAWCEGCTEGDVRMRRALLDDASMRALYKRRWSEITGIRAPAFELSLEEQRALFRFFFAHPIGLDSEKPAFGASRNTPYADAYALKKVEEFFALDPAYPGLYARGVLLYRLGRFHDAVQAFQRHLEASPDGPHTLRAQNYLRASLQRSVEP